MTEPLSFSLVCEDRSDGPRPGGDLAVKSSSQVKFNDLVTALSSRSQNVALGTVLFNAQDVPLHAFLILKGIVRIDCRPNPQMVGPGAVLGLAEGLAQVAISFEVSAVTSLEVAEISIVDVERDFGHSGMVLQGIARLAMERILHDRAFGSGS